MIYVFGTIFLLLVIVLGYLFFKYSKLKDINNSIEIASESINAVLDKKLELVNELLKDVKDKKIKEKFEYSDDFSLYEKENALFNVSFDINKYVKDKKIVKLKDKVKELNVLEENLDGLKDYYNANVLNYNEIFLKRYFNKLFRFLKFGDYKSFKIRKLEEYEIFKNQSSLKLTGLIFFDIKNLFVFENGLLPKKPFLAENGDGWVDSIM